MVDKKFIGLDKPDITRFESYLPTAFSSELTLLQKVNKIIQDLNRSFDLTNEMVEYLNGFIETFDEKLYESLDDVLNVWLENGKLTDFIRELINEEVIVARGGAQTLGERLDESDVQLAQTEQSLNARLTQTEQSINAQLTQIAKQPDKYTGIGTGSTATIKQVFPSVTLAEVQALDSQATLSNKADWYVLQKLINDATSTNKKRLNYIEGTFIIDRPINIVQKLGRNWFIEATGCTLKAADGYTGKMVMWDKGDDHATSRNGRIKGLHIDGNYTASIGIEIKTAQEWFIDNPLIEKCFVGLQLTDTYYGEMSGEPVIQDCLTGIKTVGGNSREINTVDVSNTKINFATNKRNFAPQLFGESDTDYDNRVVSIGVELLTMVSTCNFDGLTLEGLDYGYYGSKVGADGTVENSRFKISQNYFEVIKKYPIYLVSLDGYSSVYHTVTIENNRFYGNMSVFIGEGSYRIHGNEPFTLNVKQRGGYRTTVYTDLPNSLIKYTSSPTLFIKREHLPADVDAIKYNPYGNTNRYPTADMLATIQDEIAVEHVSMTRGTSGDRTKNPQMYGMTAKPMVFMGERNGPIIKGRNGLYYMIGTRDGVSLTLTRVHNFNRFDTPVNAKTAKEIYRMTNVPNGTKYYCIDLQYEVTYKASTQKWIYNYNGTDIIAIGSTSELMSNPNFTGVFGNPVAWNVQIDYGYSNHSTYWGGYDWYGNRNIQQRVFGTTAQRPTNPNVDDFIYYDTDTTTYHKWNSVTSEYNTFTKLF